MPEIIDERYISKSLNLKGEKNIVAIPSTIFFSSQPLSYSPIRSIYSPEERLVQLGKSINSCREKIKDCYIILLESSDIQSAQIPNFHQLNLAISFSHNKKLQKLANGPHKGAAEIFMLRRLARLLTNFDFDYFHKLSGRYFLNNAYQKIMTKKYVFVVSGGHLSSRYYIVPKSLFSHYKRILSFAYLFSLMGFSIETVFTKIIPQSKINCVKEIGLSGNIAVDGTIISE